MFALARILLALVLAAAGIIGAAFVLWVHGGGAALGVFVALECMAALCMPVID